MGYEDEEMGPVETDAECMLFWSFFVFLVSNSEGTLIYYASGTVGKFTMFIYLFNL